MQVTCNLHLVYIKTDFPNINSNYRGININTVN